jgi:hypothetical protein
MTAQQRGLERIGNAVRLLTPPQFDFVVLVYPTGGTLTGAQVAYTTSTTVSDGLKRAGDAAAHFVLRSKTSEQKQS